MKCSVKEILQCIEKSRYEDKREYLHLNEIEISGVSTDSRKTAQGDLFVPLSGDRFDGHSFVQMAAERGAVLSLWQEAIPIPETIPIPLLFVPDPLKALQQLAQCYREQVNPFVIGITGSNGKTTTKDLMASILSTQYRVHKTKGNLNNHIGVPLTLLSMPNNTEIVIIEMGMSGFGEIELLSKVAKPDIAVITNIGESHLEHLLSRENIAKAKLEILTGIKENGWLILNGDEPLLRTEIEKMDLPLQLIWVGKDQKSDFYPLKIEMMNTDGVHFITGDGGQYDLPLLGTHNIINSLMAIQAGKILNVSHEEMKEGLKNLSLTSMRLEKMKAKNGSTVLNDAYNASPTSMKASLNLLSTFASYKKIAILGDMLELGENAEGYHREIGKICADLQLDLLITTGSLGKWIAAGAMEHGMTQVYHFDDMDQIGSFVLEQSDVDTFILVKGSRGIHLENVVDQLIIK